MDQPKSGALIPPPASHCHGAGSGHRSPVPGVLATNMMRATLIPRSIQIGVRESPRIKGLHRLTAVCNGCVQPAPARASPWIRDQRASGTGFTERRLWRTRSHPAKAGSALISAKVTGWSRR